MTDLRSRVSMNDKLRMMTEIPLGGSSSVDFNSIKGSSEILKDRKNQRIQTAQCFKEMSKLSLCMSSIVLILFLGHLAWVAHAAFREVDLKIENANDQWENICSVTIDPANGVKLDDAKIKRRQASDACRDALYWMNANRLEEVASRVWAEHLSHIPGLSWLYGGWVWNVLQLVFLWACSSPTGLTILGTFFTACVYKLFSYLDFAVFLRCCEKLARKEKTDSLD